MERKRKKWTAKEEITDSLLKFREKRKWQVAFRRYILERKHSYSYAPFFGLDIENYRKWIELQFINGSNWNNFGSVWQFGHIIPPVYFDFSKEEDLRLCWNFININVDILEPNSLNGSHIDILSAKPYFEKLFSNTGYSICQKMIEKIKDIQESTIISEPRLENFIVQQKDEIEKMTSLTQEEFSEINGGKSLADVFLEREIVQKFG